MGLGFVPVRKPGKLPGPVDAVEYDLEYGSDRLEIVQGSLEGGPRVLVIDDLLATGGTAAACAQLVQQAGGVLCGFGFVIELTALEGRSRLTDGVPVEALIQY
jgi:adenine phosphoribosyltransferase